MCVTGASELSRAAASRFTALFFSVLEFAKFANN